MGRVRRGDDRWWLRSGGMRVSERGSSRAKRPLQLGLGRGWLRGESSSARRSGVVQARAARVGGRPSGSDRWRLGGQVHLDGGLNFDFVGQGCGGAYACP